MTRKTFLAIAAVTLAGIITLTACSGGAGGAISSNQRIRPTWINAKATGGTVSIPVSEVLKDAIAHFFVTTNGSQMTFMVYNYGGQLYARADICPPCRSTSFSLKGNTLVCDSCGTVFDATTGKGISGACVAYPKAAVTYQLSTGNMVMKDADLAQAYQDTITRG